jgi:predicted ribosome quality control (RQC) complex YloA/Tae2 family protein
MNLDSWLVDRLAREIHITLAGARVQALSAQTTDVFLKCYRQHRSLTLRAALDPAQPLLALCEGAPADEKGTAGWPAGAAPRLRGCIVDAVRAVENDRIVNIDLNSRSAFGVPALYRLTIELQTQKANALVLRFDGQFARWTIVAAAKQVRGAHGARDIIAGGLYEAPPPRRQRFTQAQFVELCEAENIDDASLRRLLLDFDPSCTPVLAREALQRAQLSPGDKRSERLLAAWYELRSALPAAAADIGKPIFVYEQDAEIKACHLVELKHLGAAPQLASSLNAVCLRRLAWLGARRSDLDLSLLRKRVAALHSRARGEREALLRSQAEAAAAESLRAAGDAIYANLSAIAQGATHFTSPDGLEITLDPALDAKQNAAAYFARFKKLRTAAQHVSARLKSLDDDERYLEQLLWELDRALEEPGERQTLVAEVRQALGLRPAGAERAALKRSAPRTVQLENAVAYVGRSPRDNERITFHLGGPEDMWFHARGVPGAHVLLKVAGSRAPSDRQILQAAALAAGQSRASQAAKVEVSYTQRKHVRKRGKGRTGQVWYTNFKSVLVAPRRLPPAG